MVSASILSSRDSLGVCGARVGVGKLRDSFGVFGPGDGVGDLTFILVDPSGLRILLLKYDILFFPLTILVKNNKMTVN